MFNASWASVSTALVLVLLIGTVFVRRVSTAYNSLLKLGRGPSGDELKQYLVRLLMRLGREFRVRTEVESMGNAVSVFYRHFPSNPLLTIKIDLNLPGDKQVTVEFHSKPGEPACFVGTPAGVQAATKCVVEYTDSLESDVA